MLNRGSTIYFGNIGEFAKAETLQDQIAREQVAHSRPGRTQGGIDMQEKGSNGSMRMKFPLKVTNVTQDIQGGSGRTARIIGTNVTLAHGAVGSANSIETAVVPKADQQTPSALAADVPQAGTTPTSPDRGAPAPAQVITAIPALASAKKAIERDEVPIDSSSPFSIYNSTPGWGSMYGSLSY